jgi:hypothetical protein
LRVNTVNIVLANLILQGGRNQNIDILRKPIFARQALIPQCYSFLFINFTEMIGDES